MGRLTGRAGQYTDAAATRLDVGEWSHLSEIAKKSIIAAQTRVSMAAEYAYDQAVLAGQDPYESDEVRIIAEIRDRKTMLEPEQARLRTLFRRWDNLYYPSTVTTGGPDHWPQEIKTGRVHVSVNVHPVYVDAPATFQAEPPVENYVPESAKDEDQAKADRAETLYNEWKDDTDFELMMHKACVVKGLYGFTFLKVAWNPAEKRPEVSAIDSPENLYVGWGASDFSRMDWALYCYGLSPQAIEELYDLSVTAIEEEKDTYFPLVTTTGDHADPIGSIFKRPGDEPGGRNKPEYEQMQVEVYDYWYKKPAGKGKRPQVWNALYIGNHLVHNRKMGEYDELPYIPLPNTYIPGSPYGKSELYDIEQLLREKDERLTNAAQMIASVTDGQRWQWVGPEVGDEVPDNVLPKANKVIAPGPGAEIKAIQPFVSEYASEDLLKRLDQELEDVSGLNPVLLGRVPPQALGSSKAINSVIQGYGTRLAMKRKLLYRARKKAWAMAAKVWEAKDSDVKAIIAGRYRIDVQPPELTHRDELETAQIALSLMQNRAWSLSRVMDATGVDNPTDEKALIREEQTDAALNPAAVTQQITLLGALAAQGITPPQQAVNQAQNAARSLNPPASGTSSLNGPENAANPPGEAVPANARAANGAPAAGASATVQSLTQGGNTVGRIMTNTPISGGGAGG